jgi:haloalkane dehalogenase
VVGAGYRAVAPTLIGFGRSEKPPGAQRLTIRHVDWMRAFMLQHEP